MTTLAAGDLNRRFRIWQPPASGTTDDAGQPITEWSILFDDIAGNIKGETGMGAIRKSGLQGDLTAAVTSYSIRIRYRTGITNSMRAEEIATGDFFNIRSVKPDRDRRNYVDLVVETGGAETGQDDG